MQARQQVLLLEQGQISRLEDFTLRQRHVLHLAVVDMQDALHQMEVHVLIHVRLLQALAGCARSQEEARLDVDTVPSVLLVFNTFRGKFLVAVVVLLGSDEVVHFFGCLFG